MSQSQNEDSRRNNSRSREQRDQRDTPCQPRKLFINNINSDAPSKDVEDELRKCFEAFGQIHTITVKKNRNSNFLFAFIEMKENKDGQKAMEQLAGMVTVAGKPTKLVVQDDKKRRKDSNKGCYTCGKMGHFARECHARNGRALHYADSRYRRSPSEVSRHRSRRRKYSRSESSDDRKKRKDRKRRHSSDHSDRKKRKRYRSSSDS